MSTRTCPKSRLLVVGLLVTLLAGLGAPALGPASVNAAPLDNPVALRFPQDLSDASLDDKVAQFEQYLAAMQRELAIPGMSAAIVKDQRVIWAQGFGYADAKARRLATADTPYEIASLTKPVSSAVLLRLVEEGRVNLEDPVSRYGVYLKSPGVIRVKHLLGMTSQGEPGSVFRYSGPRYGYLEKVIERASGQPFASVLIESVLNPLGMSDSVPITMMDQPAYAHIRGRVSPPYIVGFNTAAGLVSTVLDLARFDIALDQGRLIGPQTRALAFTAQTLSSGDPPVYGLGWFVQEFQGIKIVWHYGYDSSTHLYVKFVDHGYTLIILTNSCALGDFVSMRDPSVLRVPAALAFYKLFILDTGLGEPVDWDADEAAIAAQLQAAREAGTIEIARQELLDRYLTDRLLNRVPSAQRAIATYTRSFATAEPPAFAAQPPLAQIERVGNDTYSLVEFTLAQDTPVDIYAVGEYWLGKMVDYGGIEDVSSGKLIWEMTPERARPAGGCVVNRQETERIDLKAGTYRLHYRTDGSHSHNNWECLPPDNLFWGIALYSAGGAANVVTRPINTAPRDQRLAPLVPLTSTPVISTLEYGILWACLVVLVSVLVAVPVLRWRKNSRGGAGKRAWRWTKFAGWIAWVNSLLYPLPIFLVLVMVSLEHFVEGPLVLTSSMPSAWPFAIVSHLCIALTIVQVVMAVLSWKGKHRPLAERLYYSLVTVAACGYLVLVRPWGLIVAF